MDGREGLGGGRANETCDHWMWPNATGTCTAQPGWCGHKMHHLSSSGLMQHHFLWGCGIEMERAEQRDQHRAQCWMSSSQELPKSESCSSSVGWAGQPSTGGNSGLAVLAVPCVGQLSHQQIWGKATRRTQGIYHSAGVRGYHPELFFFFWIKNAGLKKKTFVEGFQRNPMVSGKL